MSGHRAKLAAQLGASDCVLTFTPEQRKILYPNAIESLNARLCKAVRVPGHDGCLTRVSTQSGRLTDNRGGVGRK
jgi:hypothetical protein